MKPKAIVFYTYLPPWRIDVFNAMGTYFDLTLVFLYPNAAGFTYDRELLTRKLEVKHLFWEKGFNVGSKSFRFGIFRLIKQYQPEFVFSHEYSPTSILLAVFKKLRIIKYQMVITTSDNLQMAQSVKGLKSLARRFVLAQSKGIVVYSQPVKEWYALHFPKLKVEICPNIQNQRSLLENNHQFTPIIERFHTQFNLADSPILLYVGRLAQVKGLDLLLRAFADSHANAFKLVLVGEGSQKEPLEKLVSELNLTERVVFVGFYSGAELYAWYSRAQFLVLPSRYEPFGAVVNEALVFGCPVLASKYIGALDYIDAPHNGLVFDPLDHTEFVNTLNQALKIFHNFNSERNNLMIRSFEQYIESFNRVIH